MSESHHKTIRQAFHAECLPLFICLLSTIAITLLASCSETTREEQAAEAAKVYYEHLAGGRDAEYVAGLYGSDTIREEYRSQLRDNARQYTAAIQAQRRGIIDVRTIRSVKDVDSNAINVFLLLCFGDSINEQVVVPMVEYKGRWVIK